jgi:TPR repeat protein
MSQKSFLYFAVFCLSITVIYFSETKRYNDRYGYADAPQEAIEAENPISIANDAWRLFVGSRGYVDEKQALELAQKSIELVVEQGSKELLSTLENNLSVIYSCSINPEVRDVKSGEKVPKNYSDERTKDNLIWSIFLRQINLNEDISKNFYDTLTLENPFHPVAKYMEYMNGKLPESTEEAYEVLTASAKNGDADAAMRIGFKYECGFEQIDIDSAIQWYSEARSTYLAEKKFSEAISSLERINRLKMIKKAKKII